MDRKSFIISISAAILSAPLDALAGKSGKCAPGNGAASKNLVAYFSRLGSTRATARQIAMKNGADIFEIKTRIPYTDDYDKLVKQTHRELEDGFFPELASEIPDLSQYGAVYIGYPVWCTDIPPAVQSFLKKCNLSGKAVFPFCSYYSTKWGKSMNTLERLCPKSKIAGGLAVKGISEKSIREDVNAWLGDS